MVRNKIISIIISIGLTITLTSGCAKDHPIPISTIHFTWIVDINDPEKVVGINDYVFVATINSYDNTNYEIQEVTENGENISIPYTNYSITVLENIKGNLKTNEHIPLQKYGGIREDGKKYILYENEVDFSKERHTISNDFM